MLELLSSGLVGIWFNLAGVDTNTVSLAQSATWQGLPWINSPKPVEPNVGKAVTQYIAKLKTQGLETNSQSVWLRTDSTMLADINGTIPVPAASLTKTATSLAALTTWGLDKRFDTVIGRNGEISDGVLNGDLVIQGGGDPLFVWEDAIALAQSLNQLGIRKVTGNLIVLGKFHMNYKSDPQKAGELLKQALTGINIPPALLNTDFKDVNFVKLPTAPALTAKQPPAADLKADKPPVAPDVTSPEKIAATPEVNTTSAPAAPDVATAQSPVAPDVIPEKPPTIPEVTPQKFPQVSISGMVLTSIAPTSPIVPLINHRSLPLIEIVRQMNIYSNNEIAQMLADSVGGAEQVMKIAATSAKFPIAEIQLINGSGLGVANRLSPRAVCQIFRTLQQQLQPANLTLADIFPVAGMEKIGTLKDRYLPMGTTMKTGTLNQVSALGGVMPTKDRGLVWFVIINKGSQIGVLRQQQDLLLKALANEWGEVKQAPLALSRHNNLPAYFGDIDRNIAIVPKSQ
jgi:serine-type D-Ala-D-Ala carboxypeptidase/endopeptidase (penicillin-binding protein 4)